MRNASTKASTKVATMVDEARIKKRPWKPGPRDIPHGKRRLLDVASAANKAAAVVNIGTTDLNHDAARRG